MRLRFARARLPAYNALQDDSNSTTVFVFILKRAALTIGVGIPGLYLIHLCLLAFYSSLLLRPPGHEFGPPDLNFYDSNAHITNHHSDGRPPPPPPPPPPEHQPKPPQIEDDQSHPFFPKPHLDQEPFRISDVSNTFKSHLHAQECGLNSQDLHIPFHPLCSDKTSTLDAMSWGGRPGYDQPFIPRGCDFRWFSTSEMCTILDRFSHIFIIGDSLQRMIVTALYMLLREDAGLGGIAEWDFKPSKSTASGSVKTLHDCMCEAQFNKHECSHAPVRQYTDAISKHHAAQSAPVCQRHLNTATQKIPDNPPFEMSYHELQAFPATREDLQNITATLPKTRPTKPYVFIFHHTFWNDVNITATVGWLDQLTEHITSHLSFLPRPEVGTWFPPSTRGFPRLFVTANAAGVMKNAAYLDTQNSIKIARFEADIRPHLDFRRIELLGMYNMSVQTTSSDGTHANMRTNLVKAMMVMNWLDWVGREEGSVWDAGGVGGSAAT